MSAYFHNQCVKEGHIEYVLVNNGKCTTLRSKGNIPLSKNLPPRPPLIKSFELS